MKIRFVLPLLFLAGIALAADPPAPAPAVRLTVLVDNSSARPDVKAVWGFACLVEARGHTILFDTGADPAVLKDNLAALKVDPARIEVVVISHVHSDHTWGAPGLGSLPGVPVHTPRSFAGHPRETAALESAGLKLLPGSAASPLFEGIVISEPRSFGGAEPGGESWEQCLTVDTPEGLVVIVGCSHPGILPMLEQVRRQTGRPLHFVIGGFHLGSLPETEVHRIATAMQALGVTRVSATHCTGEAAIAVFREVFGEGFVSAGSGAVITLPFAAKKP
jgi:7,8-dihydropterin-6-yl-methyl-4-(beta-D-ribofuranosyl)aminobenzene 5'-phosphate synthase